MTQEHVNREPGSDRSVSQPREYGTYDPRTNTTEVGYQEPRLTDTDDYIVRRDNWAAVTQAPALQTYGSMARPIDFQALVQQGERYLRTGEI